MNLNEIEAKCFIMALFIRDDGLRFLLGSGAYEFKDSQLMFAGNTIENDVVSVQGNDGYMLAGQVRRPSTQVFDGYIGDASVSKSEVEGYRRDFMAFFQKNHFYTVVYVMADGSAIQRRRGFLVDAPTSQELWQMYPEYHVALNFEDVNYYKYSENDDGEETYAKSADIGLAKVQYGGLIWDNNSEIEISGTGTNITLAGTMEGGAIESVELDGDTTQTTYSGKNLVNVPETFTFNRNYLNFQQFSAGTYYVSCGNVTKGGANDPQIGDSTRHIAMTSNMLNQVLDFAGTALTVYSNGWSWGDSSVNSTVENLIITTSPISSIADYEPYVGGTASPNPDYPQEVNVVTGEQSIEVRGDGKNWFNKDKTPEYRYIDSNGNWATGTYPDVNQEWSVTGNETFTISFSNIVGASAYVRFAEYNADGTFIRRTLVNTTPTTITLNANTRKLIWSVDVSQSYHFDNLQIELGSSATTYEPYKGVTKTVNLGKNLFDTEQAVTKFENSAGSTIVSWGSYSDGVVTITRSNGAYGATLFAGFIPRLIEGETYTLSATVRLSGTATGTGLRIGTNDTTPVYITLASKDTWIDASFTFTATAQVAADPRICINANNTGNIVEIKNIQLERGSAATTYAPYFTPIELCKIGTYQDYIYKSGEDWYIHKATGNQDMSALSGLSVISTGNFIASGFASNYGSVIGEMLSNIFTYSATGWEKVGKFGIAASGNLWAMTGDSTITTANIATWLSDKSAVVYYALATPTDTQITNSALISELEGLLSATTYSGTTYITVSGDLASPLEIKVITIGGGGVVWDENGAEWEAGGGGEIVIVNVDSIENILPVWTIRGEAENPTLTNLTTGMSITYNGTVASGQTLVIDLLNKTAKLNGTSVISDVSGQWVEFKPGNNRVSYSTENANAPDSTIEWQEVVG